MSKISALAQVDLPASGDLLTLVDVSDPSMGPAGTNKKATVEQVLSLVPVPDVTGQINTAITAIPNASVGARGMMTPAQVTALSAAATPASVTAQINAIPDASGSVRGHMTPAQLALLNLANATAEQALSTADEALQDAADAAALAATKASPSDITTAIAGLVTSVMHSTGAPPGLTPGAHAWAGSYNGSSAAALWLGPVTPSTANYALLSYIGGGVTLNAPGGEGVHFASGASGIANIAPTGEFEPVANGVGIVLKAPNGTRYRMYPVNDGTFTFENITTAAKSVAVTGGAQEFSGGKRGAVVTLLASAGSVPVPLAQSNNFVHTLLGSATLAAPTGALAGQSGVIEFRQGATPYTLSFDTAWKFPSGEIPALTASASAVDLFAYQVLSDGTVMGSLIKDIKR